MVELITAQFARQQQMKADNATRSDVFEQKRSDLHVVIARLAFFDAQSRGASGSLVPRM
jgi:hypothetical protein